MRVQHWINVNTLYECRSRISILSGHYTLVLHPCWIWNVLSFAFNYEKRFLILHTVVLVWKTASEIMSHIRIPVQYPSNSRRGQLDTHSYICCLSYLSGLLLAPQQQKLYHGNFHIGHVCFNSSVKIFKAPL